jgi:hypothetical protein
LRENTTVSGENIWYNIFNREYMFSLSLGDIQMKKKAIEEIVVILNRNYNNVEKANIEFIIRKMKERLA